jgi:DNA repair exonuclease SbcCD nuclease subunit
MKLAIISDLHFGYGHGTVRENECYDNARQAFEIAVREKADAILLAGDIFDEKIPKQEVWNKAFRVFSVLNSADHSDVKIMKIKGDKSVPFEHVGIPIIAIHGTHEFRGQDYSNALEVLESAGCVAHIHAGRAMIEKGNEKIAVHCMGGIPEKHALKAFQIFNPRPDPGIHNILMLHQSITEFLPTDDEMSATISLSDLPAGFDLIVNGHLHWSNIQDLPNGKFLLPGSTVITQMKRLESTKPKGTFIYDTQTKSLENIAIPVQRKFFYHKLKFNSANNSEIHNSAEEAIKSSLKGSFDMPPLIKLKLTGSLSKGINNSDISLYDIEEKYANQAIISIDKDFESAEFIKKISELRAEQKNKGSIAERGYEILEKNLKEAGFDHSFDAERAFELLSDGRTEEFVELVSGK